MRSTILSYTGCLAYSGDGADGKSWICDTEVFKFFKRYPEKIQIVATKTRPKNTEYAKIIGVDRITVDLKYKGGHTANHYAFPNFIIFCKKALKENKPYIRLVEVR